MEDLHRYHSRPILPGLGRMFMALLLLCVSPAHAAGESADTWLEQAVTEQQYQLSACNAAEQRARNALELANKALRDAQDAQDNESVALTRQAAGIAQQAIVRSQRLRSRIQARLDALHAAAARQQEDAGVAAAVRGEVSRSSGATRAAFDGQTPLQAGDRLETGHDGFVELIFPDHTLLSVGPDTLIEIAELDADKLQSAYRMIKGSLHIARKCLAYARDRRSLCWGTQFRVSHATIGVRGTEFSLEENDGEVTVTVLDGEVDASLGQQRAMARAMERLTLDRQGVLHGPLPVKPQELTRWWMP